MHGRVAVITLGQTPRTDLVPELAAWLPPDTQVVEYGALDGLAPTQIQALAPASSDLHVVSRLRDGTQVVLAKHRVEARVQALLAGLDPAAYDAATVLCTGRFQDLEWSGFLLDAGRAVEHGIEGVCHDVRHLGVLLPIEEQVEERARGTAARRMSFAVASPYDDDDFGAAGAALAGCDVVVMDCMGYSEAHRSAVARASGRPVLLARRLLGAALAQLV